jgi:succinate-semialdehyde dehydrogenase / glutarate-semialdehyde dehydrogenase
LVKDRGEQFTHKLSEITSTMRAGDSLDTSTTLTPITSERSLQALLARLETAVAAGAKMVVGGKRIERAVYYLEPTIVTNITSGSLRSKRPLTPKIPTILTKRSTI